VTTRSTNERENQTYISSGRTWKNIPTIVLINESSASASEITAGALQDYNLALIVGTKSYGKGSVQQAFPLLNSGELKITIAHWFTPKNRNIEKEKIIPDILIENTLEDIQKKNDRQKQVATEVLQEWIKNKSYQKTLLQFKK
jgi:carboxyl-terminal processing protease